MASELSDTHRSTETHRIDTAVILASRGLRQFAYRLLALGIPFLLAGALKTAYDLSHGWYSGAYIKVGWM